MATVNEVVQEARERWEYANKVEGTARRHFADDFRFAFGDAYNLYQWPTDVLKSRQGPGTENRPCLTINKTQQHNLQIINDAKQNKPGIKFRAMGSGASFRSAQMCDALAKHVENQSNAQAIYDQQVGFMVNGGWGYLRVVTDYVSEDELDQEIFICGFDDPLMVFLDPDAREVDKLDSNWGMVFQDLKKEDAEKKYPRYKDLMGLAPLGDTASGWIDDDHVRIAEYYRRVEKKDVLYVLTGGDGKVQKFRKSELMKAENGKDLVLAMDEKVKDLNGGAASRETSIATVEYYLIIGQSIAERKVWPGKYVPIVLVVGSGREFKIDGQVDRISHTRGLIDPQRMYNFWSSAGVEYGALQTKTPWLTPMITYEEYQQYYDSANTSNRAVLPYRHVDDEGNPVPPPQRIEPPMAAPVAVQGLAIASQEFMMASGQYQSTMGEQGNERSGKAINERQRQGENATYHFTDGLAISIRALGKILLDLFPKIYDTERVIMASADDGSEMEIKIDPNAAKAYEQKRIEDMEAASHVFNPNLGRYEVMADVGPSYGTRRQETFNALTLILTQAPALVPLIGDLLVRSADFELAEEAARRLRRMVPKEALGEGPSQSEQQMQMQVQQLTSLLTGAMRELSEEKLKAKGREQKRDVEAYNAITNRLKAMFDGLAKSGQVMPIKDLNALVQDELNEALSASVTQVQDANVDSYGLNAIASGQGELPLGGNAPYTPPSVQ